jgi:hypothetical protein
LKNWANNTQTFWKLKQPVIIKALHMIFLLLYIPINKMVNLTLLLSCMSSSSHELGQNMATMEGVLASVLVHQIFVQLAGNKLVYMLTNTCKKYNTKGLPCFHLTVYGLFCDKSCIQVMQHTIHTSLKENWNQKMTTNKSTSSSSSFFNSTTLGGSRSVQQFYPTPLYPPLSLSNQ